jgi:hypothetical protein
MLFNVIDPYHVTLVVIALITGVLSPILLQITKYYISSIRRQENKCEVSKSIKYEDLITFKLDKIRESIGCDRVWVVEFHNGTHTFTGKSFQKFSVTYESVKSGISREGPQTQNLPTSLFSRFFNTVSEEGIFSVEDVSRVNASNSSMQSFFESRGIKSFFAVGIRNIENNLIGVLCTDSIFLPMDMTAAKMENLQKDANILAGYLESL